MPRNKRLQDRDEKCAEIIKVARRMFLDTGYEATSMNRLAAETGIAANTIYWYFKDKDDVLVAVLNAEFAERWQAYQQCPLVRPADKLLWFIEQLEHASRLINTVHARVQLSAPINAWHERFHLLTEGLLSQEIAQRGIDAERRNTLMKIWIFTIEGLLAHTMSAEQKRAICEALAGEFI